MISVDAKAARGNGEQRRAVIYARVSTDRNEQQGSVDNQVEIYTERITNDPSLKYAGTYSDPAVSGTTGDRPQFRRMMEDARNGKFDVIFCKSISRFARNTVLSVSTVRELKDMGISVVFEKENIDTSKEYSEMMLTIMSAFAQEESRNTSERIKKGNHMRAMNGEVSWTPLYGFCRVDDEEYMLVEEEADIVRRVFDEYERGRTYRQIAAGLNSDGIPSPGGVKWNLNSVLGLVSNEKYMGDVVTNKYFTDSHMTHKLKRNHGEVERISVEGHHGGIISEGQFERVRKIREMRTRFTYPYEGILTCPDCGGKLIYESDFLGPKRPAWKCDTDEMYFPAAKIAPAILEAYRQLDAGNLDEKTKWIKEENPEFASVEYWWLDELVDSITFGAHGGKDDQTLTVEWKCGVQTTVPTGMGTMERLRRARRIQVRKTTRGRAEKKVTKIRAGA